MNTNKSETFESVGNAMWEQRHRIKNSRDQLLLLHQCVGHPGDTSLPQYAQLYAIALEFQPDLIIEVGRGYGNTTCVLTEAANELDQTTVVSICLSESWQKNTLPNVVSVVPNGWLEKLNVIVANVCDVDIGGIIENHQRILLFWDAHGWEVAEYMLGTVLSTLQTKSHIVLIHDILDIDYHPELRNYAGHGIWKGYPGDSAPVQYVITGSLCSAFEEVVALADFATRNHLEVHSAEKEIRQEIETEKDRKDEMINILGDQMYSPDSSFHWITLNHVESNVEITFPRYNKYTPILTTPKKTLVSELVLDINRFNKNDKPTFLTFTLILIKIILGRYKLRINDETRISVNNG